MSGALIRVAAPLRSQVEGGLRDMIASGSLEPGERLVERALCERFGVSRPVMREAMRQLEAERLVEAVANRGVFVLKPRLEDAVELFQVRAELEGLASALAARRATAALLAPLDEALVALGGSVAAEDREGMRAAKNAFYVALVAASGNSVLEDALRGLRNRIQLFRGAALANPGRAADALAELTAICEAIRARDPEGARARTRTHLSNAARALAAALAPKREDPKPEGTS